MSHAAHPNFNATMDVVFPIHGNAILKTTVVMVQTKEISVPKRPVPTTNSHVLAPDIAFPNLGSATETTIASTNKTNKTVLQSHAYHLNSNAPI